MRDRLAEELLARVMEWEPQEVAAERALLQTLGDYKYDEYQQFAPGMRFLESLAYWLDQFTPGERRHAYEFVKSRLVYCSVAEMNHLVAIAYPDCVRPLLLARAGRELGVNPWHSGKIEKMAQFQALQRQTLFLGLSDGARTDVFRRANGTLSHEQVRQSHELADERVDKLLEKLRKGLAPILRREPTEDEVRFRCIVLMDDFSASGLSYLRKEGSQYDGKIGTFLQKMFDASSRITTLVKHNDLEIFVVLYMATESARQYLESHLKAACDGGDTKTHVVVVHLLPEEAKVPRGQDPTLDAIIDAHYDSDNETDSTRLGGTDLKYGFAWCGLPLVISHNTPNNSIGLLWAEGSVMRPLFPRVARHRDRV
ncbi:MAG: hypothetical protein AB7L71_00425 [Vicinamibacterales bacterium]